MDIRQLTSGVLIIALAGCTTSPTPSPQQEQPELRMFRHYALAICLGAAFKDTPVTSDLNKAANGYFERGNMPLEAYEELREISGSWLEKDYPSKHGEQVNSAKCFDFAQSLQITTLYEKYNPCRREDDWLDPQAFIEACAP